MNALRIVSLLIAVAVLSLLGWRATVRPAPVSTAARPAPRIAALADAMRSPAPLAIAPLLLRPADPPAPAAAPPPEGSLDVPEFASFYGRLKSDYPRDYDAVFGRTNAPSSANAAIWDALRDLRQSKGILAAEAGDAALDRFFDARSALLDGLAPLNARQCVDFLYGVTDSSIADFTAAHRGLVATLADRTLDAIADGRARHLDRPAPTSADLDALSSGLSERGLSPTEIGLLIDGTTPDPPLPDARFCDIGRAYLDVLHGLPTEARQRIYGLAAQLLARS